MAAVDIDLSPEDVRTLDAAVPSGGVVGDRYAERDMPLLNH